jgi:excisionase family DNA binding protein
LSLREAAELSRLHYMTLYRHVRTGRLAAIQSGGHWWVKRSDLAALGRRDPPGRRPGPARWGRLSKRLEGRLLSGDVTGAWALVETALAHGARPSDIYLEALAPALRHIGKSWASGKVAVRAEHVATEAALRLMGRLGPNFYPRGSRANGAVILGAAPGDPHLVPVMMAADLLRSCHFSVLDLGANVPEESFLEVAKVTAGLRAVGVSLSDTGCAGAAARCLASLRATLPGVLLLAGGPALTSSQQALDLGADAWAPDGLAAGRLLSRRAEPRPRQ